MKGYGRIAGMRSITSRIALSIIFAAAAVTAERLGRYEFQFVMGPLVLRRGTASPVNPLAIF